MSSRSLTVGKTADVKRGELVRFDVEGLRIAIANTDGRFFAIDDTCTHEQCSLADEGALEGTVVTCGCHGAQFDVSTGAVLAPPAFEPLKAYRLCRPPRDRRAADGGDTVRVAAMQLREICHFELAR